MSYKTDIHERRGLENKKKNTINSKYTIAIRTPPRKSLEQASKVQVADSMPSGHEIHRC